MKNKDLIRDLERVANGQENTKIEQNGRRVWLQNFAMVSATSAVLWACGKKNDDNANASGGTTATDIANLNAAADLEFEAIAIYKAAAGLSDVWSTSANGLAPTFLEIAKSFLAHHIAHQAALAAKVTALGGTPSTTKPDSEYLGHYPGIAGLKGPSGLLTVLQVAAEREYNAASAYASLASKFSDQTSGDLMASICPDEAAHAGVLNAAAFVLNATDSGITAANIVPGTFAPLKYHKTVRS